MTRTLEELAYAVTTLDVRPECKADFTVDIRSWKYWTTCRPGDFEILWASIPCTEFSQALTTRDRDLRTADSIARRTLKIIRWLKPNAIFHRESSRLFAFTTSTLYAKNCKDTC